MQEILWIIISLAAVFGLLFLLLYGLKRLNSRVSVNNGGKMRVLDRVTIGRDGLLLVVSVGGKLMLIGATPQHIEKLGELDISAEEYSEQLREEIAQGGFASVLSAMMNRGKNAENESEKDSEDDKKGV